MRSGGRGYSCVARRLAKTLGGPRLVISRPWAVLVVLALLPMIAAPVRAADLADEALSSLPWAALPPAQTSATPARLALPPISLVLDFDPYLTGGEKEPAIAAAGATLWSSEDGSLTLGFALDQIYQEDHLPEDKLFGVLRKRYRAIFTMDQPIGFRTAVIIDVLSKDKRRGQRQFRIFQAAISRPVGDGNLTAGSAVLLSGLNPELNLGIRFFLPLGVGN